MNGSLRGFLLAGLAIAIPSGCVSTDSTSDAQNGDWYYHWNCNGDAQCLATNPTGQPTGNSDEGPVQAACTELVTFAQINWGSAATDSCDQNPSGGASAGGPPSACDAICSIENGPSIAKGTSYWEVPVGSFSAFAIYADHTGQLFADGDTLYSLPGSSQTFSWAQTAPGSNVILITGLPSVLIGSVAVQSNIALPFSSPAQVRVVIGGPVPSPTPSPPKVNYYTITQLTVTSGSTAKGYFSARFVPSPLSGAPGGDTFSGSLVSGSFNKGVLLPLGGLCSSDAQCASDVCSCLNSQCATTKVICN